MKTEKLNSYPEEHQKNYIKNSINQALKQTKNKEAFVQYLALRNIDVVFNENKAGIKGVGFKTLNIENPTYFKGSDVHRSFSWNKLKEHFDYKEQKIEISKTNKEMNVNFFSDFSQLRFLKIISFKKEVN